MDLFSKVLADILKSLYMYLFASALMAFLFMFAYNSFKEQGIKKILLQWINSFRTNREFRISALLVFYLFMVLFKTVLVRKYTGYSLRNVIGVWGVYNTKGKLYIDNIENFILFIPLAALYLEWRKCVGKKHMKLMKGLWTVGKKALFLSLIIEFGQLFFRLGAFQLSDLLYNTTGAVVGGLLYYFIYKIKHKEKTNEF